jgi:hydrogenase maturation factor
VHVGFAINEIDETEAQEVFRYVEEIERIGAEQEKTPTEVSSE